MQPIDLSTVETTPQDPRSSELPTKHLLERVEGTDDYILKIDNSNLEVFATCPRSALWKLIYSRDNHLKPALHYGGALHEGLAEHYRGKEEADCVKAIRDYWGTVTFPETEWRSLDRCVETLLDYRKHWKVDPLEIDHVEEPFCLPLCEIILDTTVPYPEVLLTGAPREDWVHINKILVYWTGKIDIMARLDGMRWVTDHKTTSVEGATYWKNFDLSTQMLGYTWAGTQMLDEPPSGMIANVILGRQKTKTGTSQKFMRQRFHYRKDQVDEWKQDTISKINDFVHNLTQGYFPKNTSWCTGKYGLCSYHDVCTLPPDARMSLLMSDQYTRTTWSPLD